MGIPVFGYFSEMKMQGYRFGFNGMEKDDHRCNRDRSETYRTKFHTRHPVEVLREQGGKTLARAHSLARAGVVVGTRCTRAPAVNSYSHFPSYLSGLL
jgi:hypothetical protein